jgi:PII-like signaling protein
MGIQQHSLLRVYTDEAALLGDQRIFEVVLERARAAKLLGATVHRAQTGFGHSALLHKRGFLDHNYPVIVEIVDVEANIRAFWASIAGLIGATRTLSDLSRSAVQHFAAGVVFAAIATEIIPDVMRAGTP